ncbi:putative alkaline serine protease AorO [Ilyonectria robusta]|uniref:putative alkaline serine protease AorO n=1 Tax=Ilyonectria robusta TaxID=1079257 RepID=UPI001E8DCA5A|nr:putative alkaline serine protease AorO [Ilyonectria robusta]KAH8679313.1 putative alkaline serine protease AorO [Ilyonectria robusta]
MKIIVVFVSAFCAAAFGRPFGENVIHQRRGGPAKLVKTAPIDSNVDISVRIALKQRNLDQGMNLLMDVSDPDSPNYGKHYTAEQVVDLFSPDADSIEIVKSWLAESGVEGVTTPKSKGWIDFKTTAKKLETLLETTYHVYEYTATGDKHLGTDSYKLPSQVSQHVDFITPGIVTDKIVPVTVSESGVQPGRPLKLTPISAAECDTHMTPICIKALYNITDGTLKNPKNRMGIFESMSEMYEQSDLNKFYSLYAKNIPAGTGPKVDLIDWGTSKPDPSQAEGEAALDFDVALPIIYPQGTELYQANSNFESDSTVQHLGFINQFLDAVDGSYCTYSSHGETGDDPNVDGVTPNEQCGTFKPANVISFSYGLAESYYPANYLERQCEEFMKLGLQGVSIVFSSGDGGVAGGHGYDCLGNTETVFNPQGPSSCPYVTAVGSTYLPKGSSIGGAEVATDSFSSGGGFSNIWTMPAYQKSAVDSFFASHDPGFPSYNTKDGIIPFNTSTGVFNRAGRGFPDIAAVGDNGVIVFQGDSSLSGGTSMSAPIFAAILTRINEERIQAGKNSIGFANPALCKNPSMFHDIVSGGQTDAAGGGACAGKGFSAVAGWDPVTGLGTPNYPALLQYFKGL